MRALIRCGYKENDPTTHERDWVGLDRHQPLDQWAATVGYRHPSRRITRWKLNFVFINYIYLTRFLAGVGEGRVRRQMSGQSPRDTRCHPSHLLRGDLHLQGKCQVLNGNQLNENLRLTTTVLFRKLN